MDENVISNALTTMTIMVIVSIVMIIAKADIGQALIVLLVILAYGVLRTLREDTE